MDTGEHKIYHCSVDSVGRVLLPAELRSALDLERGARVVIEPEGRGARITPLRRVIEEVQDYFCQYKQPGESVVDELLRERHEEATAENRE